jgi:hypothetical protein
MVISRATSSCQPRDASLIRIPRRQSRVLKAMMVTTVTSAPGDGGFGDKRHPAFRPRLRPPYGAARIHLPPVSPQLEHVPVKFGFFDSRHAQLFDFERNPY